MLGFNFMFTIYVIKSLTKKFSYVGFTNNIARRFEEHNLGYKKSTKSFKPFKLIYTEFVNTRVEARVREKFLKSGKGREFIKSLDSQTTSAGSPIIC
jgi:putative endonuclease